jgi:hypothetical protein
MSAKLGRLLRVRLVILALGVLVLSAGIIGVARVLLFSQPDDMKYLDVSLTGVIVGAMMVGQSSLAKYRVSVDEAYHLGHDVGIEEGFKQGRRVGRPVVVDLSYPKDEVQIRRHPE